MQIFWKPHFEKHCSKKTTLAAVCVKCTEGSKTAGCAQWASLLGTISVHRPQSSGVLESGSMLCRPMADGLTDFLSPHLGITLLYIKGIK